MEKTKISCLSLGCARNLVDAEVMLGYLAKAGFAVGEELEGSNVAMVNTCCFIREAEEESIDAILQLVQLKKEGKINKIIVSGCLSQRYTNKLRGELPEVDAFVGAGSINKIVATVKQLIANGKTINKFGPPKFLYTHSSPRIFLTPKHFAYVKISEGCEHHCSYCIIPRIRGRYRSRPIHSILKEAAALLDTQGVSEINLIGQDTTMYGQDLYGRSKIDKLLAKISLKAKGRWVRLLYAHPANISSGLMEVIKQSSVICKYIDLPLQHINDKILVRMNRQTQGQQILALIERLRKEIPRLAIRSTLIVGFPGETDRQFKELLDFIRQVRFERLGLFKYSREAKTSAFNFSRQIPEKVKQLRYDEALRLQQDISRKINEGFLGKELAVLIDEQAPKDKNLFLGRTEYDAPEVDGCVYVKSKQSLQSGDFVQVKITDTLEYDLVGETI